MFGMLDYRAYQLYRILFFVPNTVLYFVGLLGCPSQNVFFIVSLSCHSNSSLREF